VEFIRQFQDLLSGVSSTDEDWDAFFASWPDQIDRFSREVGHRVPDDQMAEFLASLAIPIIRNGFVTGERKVELFDRLQALGAHFLPVHFYSPVPDTASLPDALWDRRYDAVPGWSLRETDQLVLLSKLGSFSEELKSIDAFDWENPQLNRTDASLYYAMIRRLGPRKVLEVGAGYSTWIAGQAALRNGHTVLHAIEPYPARFLTAGVPGLAQLIQQPVQEIPVDVFTALDAGDFLFIDSTHVCKIGSDVTYLILDVLPRLQPGVVVHIHDIFLPWNMPKEWVKKLHQFWNEQYLLLAFLQGNRDFEVLLASHYLGVRHPERLKEAFPDLSIPGGGSFWMRRVC
jgi:predicted O-methyltransferase YrrM